MRHASSARSTLTLWILLLLFCLAIAPAHAQNLFVANQAGNTIREFSPSGVDLGDFATTGLNGPTGLAFDKNGNLYVSNIAGNTIRKFSPTGEDLGDFATTGRSAPRGIAFDKRGNLYVANAMGPGAGWIRKFSPAGEDLGNFATTGIVLPALRLPRLPFVRRRSMRSRAIKKMARAGRLSLNCPLSRCESGRSSTRAGRG